MEATTHHRWSKGSPKRMLSRTVADVIHGCCATYAILSSTS